MVLSEIPSARAFQAIRSVSVTELSRLKEEEVRPLLPCLVRMALCSPVDESPKWTEARKEVQKLLSGLEVVNSIVALLSVDFSLLEQDALKEQQLRRKVGGNAGTSVLVENLQNGLALEFERSEPSRRLRLVLSELLRIMSQVSQKLLWLATLLEKTANNVVLPLHKYLRDKTRNSILMMCHYPDVCITLIWLVVLRGKIASTDQKQNSDLGGEMSSL